MNTLLKLPFYAKATLLLIGLYLTVSVLSIGSDILLPLMYATIIAVFLSPAIDFLVRKKINRTLSITVVLLFTLIVGIGFIILLSLRLSMFSDALPDLETKLHDLITQVTNWVSVNFNIRTKIINAWIANVKVDMLSNTVIGNTLTSMGGMLAVAFLTPVYVFMLLLYQSHLVKFLHKAFGFDSNNQVNELLTETKTIIQSYLVGLFIEFVIVSVLNVTGLLILGIEYAILIGILGGLLNVIPYLGGAITMMLFAVIALVTKSPIYAIYAIGLYGVIQFIDNNYIVPKIVGSKVKLNALISLIAVILGAALWGIPGMFLSIPLTAILKLIFDRIDALKPWGFLLGDTVSYPIQLHLKKIIKRKREIP